MLSKILVPLDGSRLSERALPYAEALARASQARLILLRGTSTVGLSQQSAPVPEAAAEVQAIANRLAAVGVVAEPWVRHLYYQDAPPAHQERYDQEVARLIVETARQQQSELIVISTHGRSGLGRWISGSVADQVLRHADRPVLLISSSCERIWPADRPPRVLVPLDGSALAHEALAPANELAQTLGGELILLQVVETPRAGYADDLPGRSFDPTTDTAPAKRYLQGAADELRRTGMPVSVHVTVGDPPLAISIAAHQQDADVIAMATHGRGGLARLVLGSVATATLHRAGIPLLLVRPAAVRPVPESEKKETVAAT